MITTY
jgi:hypothetical protein